MEIIAGIVAALVGLLLYNVKKRKDAERDALLNETRGRDAELKDQQNEVEAAINEIDRNIEKAREERERRLAEEKTLSLAERRARLRAKYNKK